MDFELAQQSFLSPFWITNKFFSLKFVDDYKYELKIHFSCPY